MAAGEPQPSEVALFVAALLPSLPAPVVRDLQALLAARLTFVGAAQAREARLGLLLDLVAVSEGELPAMADYEAERRRRQAHGEDWPHASVLIRAYNDWARACRAAMRLHFRSGAGVSVKAPSGERQTPYKRAEMLHAVIAFCEANGGRWPTYTEFFVWRRHRRQHARMTGAPALRLPDPASYRSYFPDFAAAVRTARRTMADRRDAPGMRA